MKQTYLIILTAVILASCGGGDNKSVEDVIASGNLEQIKANSGLNDFRVVMDDSNNTPDTIDRNMLVGQIFLQPSRTAEFIVLDFVVQPTGAAFPE